jgi:hypothetical protein
MMIEGRVEAATQNEWPECAGILDPLPVPRGEKREDTHPERQALLKLGASRARFRDGSRIQNECRYCSKGFVSEREIQV